MPTAHKPEVEAFLTEARLLITTGRRFLVPRDVNVQGLFDLGISEAQAWDLIARLTPNNYCKGPEADHNSSGTFLWFFGASVEKTPVYIKLKIEAEKRGRLLKCLSIHPATDAMRYPLRPRFEKRRSMP